MESLTCPSCGSPNLVKINTIEYKCENCNTSSKLSNDKSYLVLLNGYPCPNCGAVNQSDVRFCSDCGTKLVKICISCGVETQIDRKFCPNCGNSNFDLVGYKDVILKPGGQNYQKIEVIKLLRKMTPLGLVEAKEMVENVTVIASHVSIDEANKLKAQFEQFGAIIEIVPSSSTGNQSSPRVLQKLNTQIQKGGSCMLVMTLVSLPIIVFWITAM